MSPVSPDFSVDPSLNLSIGGGPSTPLDRSRLSLIKDEIRDNPNATRRYIKTLSEQFVPGMQSELTKIPPNSNLIVMPSTTRRNNIPAVLAAFLKKERPDLHIINAGEDIIKVAHQGESKIKSNYLSLAEDPRRYVFAENKVEQLAKSNRPSYIIDDSISTGETAIVLQRQLSKRGVYAQGLVAAIYGGKPPYVSDMKRVFEKITENYPASYSPEQLREDIHTQFAGFPRKKISDFEFAVRSSVPDKREAAIHYLRQSSDYYRTEQLDPASTLARIPAQHRQLTPRDQLRLDFPSLSDKDIDTYAKLQEKQQAQSKGRLRDSGLEL